MVSLGIYGLDRDVDTLLHLSIYISISEDLINANMGSCDVLACEEPGLGQESYHSRLAYTKCP